MGGWVSGRVSGGQREKKVIIGRVGKVLSWGRGGEEVGVRKVRECGRKEIGRKGLFQLGSRLVHLHAEGHMQTQLHARAHLHANGLLIPSNVCVRIECEEL
jgi:hypothetical protein